MAEDSSPAELAPDAAAPPPSSAPETPDVSAPSSEAETTGETKETLLEAVTKAVTTPLEGEEGREQSPRSEDADRTEQEAKEEGEHKGPDLTKDPTPEELAAYKKDTRQRIERLLSERNSFRAEADVTRVLRDFLVANDIAKEDFQLTLDLAAAMRRGDFKAFLDGVGPYVQLATQALGITLPPDLQHEVQTGRVSHDVAAQISRERYARALAEQRATRATQVMSDQHTHRQTADLQRSIESTVAQWEQGVKAVDPDYGRKEETIRNFLWAVVREQGNPSSPEHAVQIAQEAYNRANNTFRQLTPPPRPTRAVPSSVNRAAAPGARPEPTSLMEAAMQGLERARSRA